MTATMAAVIITAAGAREFICLLAPYFVVAAGLMWYNWARFGSPTDFGANYNLTVHDMPKRGLDAGRIAFEDDCRGEGYGAGLVSFWVQQRWCGVISNEDALLFFADIQEWFACA